MAVIEKSGILKYKDKAGNTYLMLPITSIDNVEGLENALAGKSATSHTHSAASASEAGFMSSTDKSKLDGIASGANKTTVDSAMSTTSTNPVQNKVIAAAIDSAIQSAIQNTWEASY